MILGLSLIHQGPLGIRNRSNIHIIWWGWQVLPRVFQVLRDVGLNSIATNDCSPHCRLYMKNDLFSFDSVHMAILGQSRLLQLAAMLLILGLTIFVDTVLAIGPSKPAASSIIQDAIRYRIMNADLLTAALIEEMCFGPGGLDALRHLDFVHYASGNNAL